MTIEEFGRIIDISPALSPAIAVWPGDRPFEHQESLRLEAGDPITLGSVATTLHVGAHADAPRHYHPAGAAIARRPLDLYLGSCAVVDLSDRGARRITAADLTLPPAAPRLLFKTGSFPDPERFTRDFAALSAELIEALAAAGVRLIGIDTPSIDLFADEGLEAHRAAARHDLAVLEGLVLSDVPAGRYTLVALPLKLEGADASPVRAVLLAP